VSAAAKNAVTALYFGSAVPCKHLHPRIGSGELNHMGACPLTAA